MRSNHFSREHKTIIRRLIVIVLPSLLIFNAIAVYPQGVFSSGSTGADGAFNPTTSQTVQLPPSGIFNYTTVNIPSGVTITYARNAANTPVTILATGNVVINGAINLGGGSTTSALLGAAGAPGGFDGSRGATGVGNDIQGTNGGGPGGGGGGLTDGSYGGGGGFAVAGLDGLNGGSGGKTYGSAVLIPLVGGSGGGGGARGTFGDIRGGSGGGGGGAILIASSTSIAGSGSISANGGASNCFFTCGGGGAGGGIRLVANSMSGSLSFQALGGRGSFSQGTGGNGYVRIEAYDFTTFSPVVSAAKFTTSTPTAAIPPSPPQLKITSVAGINVPTIPVGSFNALPDITVPTAQTSPVTVALTANNIPTSTIVSVKVVPENGAPVIVQSSPLSGTQAASVATASITLSAGTCLISATTTIDLTLAQANPLIINGERVDFIEVSATFGGNSNIVYVTHSGRRISGSN